MADMMTENNIPQRYIRVKMFGDEFIPVVDVYPFIYESEKGKMVLRIRILEGIKTFEELRKMFAEDNVISSWEDETKTVEEDLDANGQPKPNARTYKEPVLRNEFEHFCKDYKCDYSETTGEYFIELTRKTDTELALEANEAATLDAYSALVELYEMNM